MLHNHMPVIGPSHRAVKWWVPSGIGFWTDGFIGSCHRRSYISSPVNSMEDREGWLWRASRLRLSTDTCSGLTAFMAPITDSNNKLSSKIMLNLLSDMVCRKWCLRGRMWPSHEKDVWGWNVDSTYAWIKQNTHNSTAWILYRRRVNLLLAQADILLYL